MKKRVRELNRAELYFELIAFAGDDIPIPLARRFGHVFGRSRRAEEVGSVRPHGLAESPLEPFFGLIRVISVAADTTRPRLSSARGNPRSWDCGLLHCGELQ